MKTTFFCILLSFMTQAGCEISLPEPGVQQDEALIDFADGKVVGCWMAKKGDIVPSPRDGAERARFRVDDGDWADALGRVGLDPQTCAALTVSR